MTKTNIVLIGMPGSGKTTVGEFLSNALKRPVIDTDSFISVKAKKTIPELFEKGEETFRSAETEAIQELAERENTIIPTGGGCILKEENMDALGQNGTIIFIDRSVENIIQDIEESNRPLLANGKERLYSLYQERIELYKKYADITVENTSTIDELLKKIIASLDEVEA